MTRPSLEMFNIGLVRFGIVLSKFSCRWLDSRTIHVPSMNGISNGGLRRRMHIFYAHYVQVGDLGIKALGAGSGLY